MTRCGPPHGGGWGCSGQGERETSKYSLEIKAGCAPPPSTTPALSALEMPLRLHFPCPCPSAKAVGSMAEIPL